MYYHARPESSKKHYSTKKPKQSSSAPTGSVQRKEIGHSNTRLTSDSIKPLQAKIDFSQASQPVQRLESANTAEANHSEAPPRVGNRTGLPDNLKTGMESLSGISLDDVNVQTINMIY